MNSQNPTAKQYARWATLYTKKCIITGEEPHCWTGHVTATVLNVPELRIIAGFKDQATLDATRKNQEVPLGCFGDWKPEYGIATHERSK